MIFRWMTRHSISNEAFRGFIALLNHLGVAVPSKKRLTTLVIKLTGLRIQKFDICRNGCVLYSSLAYETDKHCPRCKAPRHRPLTKKQQQQLPLPKPKPHSTVDFFHPEALIKAYCSDPASARRTRLFNEATSEILATPPADRPRLIYDVNEAGLFQHYQKVGTIKSRYTVTTKASSDGFDIFNLRDPGKPNKGHIQTLTVLSDDPKDRAKHSNQWRLQYSKGPSPDTKSAKTKASPPSADSKSFLAPMILALHELEKPQQWWNGEVQDYVEHTAVLAYKTQDTVEAHHTDGIAGATGKCCCSTCLHEGILAGGSSYSAPFLAPAERVVDDNGVEVVQISSRRDVLLPGTSADAGREDRQDLPLRTWNQRQRALEHLEAIVDRPEQEKRDARRDLGNQGPGVYDPLASYKAGIPWFTALDPMHADHVCFIPLIFDCLTGAITTIRAGPDLSETVLEAMDRLHLASAQYKATATAQTVRSFQKMGHFKAWEWKSIVVDELPALVLNLGLDPQIEELLLLLSKVIRLLDGAVVDTGDYEGDPMAFDVLALRPDGLDVVPLDVVEKLLGRLLILREVLFYNRDPGYLLKVVTATPHRMAHRAAFLRMLGPSRTHSQQNLESVIGVDKRKVGSRFHPLANMATIGRDSNLLLLLDRKYTLPPLTLPTQQPPSQTHSKLPNISLLHPVDKQPGIKASLLPLLDDFLSAVSVARSAAKPVRWGRLELATGERVRSGWSEDVKWLPRRTVEREHGQSIASGEWAAGEKGSGETTGKDGARSARFIFVSDLLLLCSRSLLTPRPTAHAPRRRRPPGRQSR